MAKTRHKSQKFKFLKSMKKRLKFCCKSLIYHFENHVFALKIIEIHPRNQILNQKTSFLVETTQNQFRENAKNFSPKKKIFFFRKNVFFKPKSTQHL